MAERTLVLLRHGKSDWSTGGADIDRPLAKRGRRQATEAGRWLAASGLDVELAVVSPARRATSTWSLVAAELGEPPPTRVDDRVYGASAEELLGVVQELADGLSAVLMVGHNPGLEDLVLLLTGEWAALPTSALAVVSLSDSWSIAGSSAGTLRVSGRPPTEAPT